MKKKRATITFVRPAGRTVPRCSTKKFGVSCIKKENHQGPHRFSARKADAMQERADKKKKVPLLAKLDCLAMVEDPIYRAQLLADFRARVLRPAVECMIWYYAKGKPKEMVEHSGTLSLQEELSALSTEELRARALDIAAMLSTTDKHVH